MALRIQTSDGLTDSANAYVEAAAVRSYATDRGVDLSAKDDAALEVAIIQATDFLDAVFSYVGYQTRVEQGTAWPRRGVPRLRDLGLPLPLLNACCKLAIRAAQGTVLLVDPATDPSGLVVTSTSTKVGPIEKSVSYASAPGGVSTLAMSRRFPDVEAALSQAGVLLGRSGGAVLRA